ncbi:TPA: hypothetical protein ACGN05_001066, partial [Streptococcus agalactiae]
FRFPKQLDMCFGTIRNSTALKRCRRLRRKQLGFGTIRNSTALKLTHHNAQDIDVLEPFETAQL